MIDRIVLLGRRGQNKVVADNSGILHDCPSQTGVAVRYCLKCGSAFDNDGWEADTHQREEGHWVPWCLFCESCETRIFEGFNIEGPSYFVGINLKEALRILKSGQDLQVLRGLNT